MDDFLYFLCHDCHKVLTFSEAEGTGLPAGSEIEQDGCPKCEVPFNQINYDMLKNPLHKCKCGKIIFAVVPELFECEQCLHNYESMLLSISDVASRNEVTIDVVRELPIFDHVLQCSGFHDISIDPSAVLTYINSVIN